MLKNEYICIVDQYLDHELIILLREVVNLENNGRYWLYHPYFICRFLDFQEASESRRDSTFGSKKLKRRIVIALSKKYEIEMYNKYWDNHRGGHYESGKNKCARTNPYIEFTKIKSEGSYYQFKILIRAEDHKRRCWVAGGKVNITL